MTKQINLIPEKIMDEAKSYRSAGGYPWHDFEAKIPGDDRVFSGSVADARESIYNEFRSELGEITILTRDEYVYSSIKAKPVARIDGMWCGSETIYIFAGNVKKSSKKDTGVVLVDDGFLSPEPKHGEKGYCRKCHSYCFGDCQANA